MSTEGSTAMESRWNDHDDNAFVSFFLGPVQSFIETARTVRDLWTGSYLLSYLTFQAMQPIIEWSGPEPERAFVFPAVEELPLWKLGRSRKDRPLRSSEERALLTPCIPNKFIAVLPRAVAPELARQCEEACRGAWNLIAKEVWEFLKVEGALLQDEQPRWDAQIASFFEIRCTALPWRDANEEALSKWLDDAPGDDAELWSRRMNLRAGLMEATRSVRHVPNYFPDGPVPQKCTLLGSYEQMGRRGWANPRNSGEFSWRAALTRGLRPVGMSVFARSAWSSALPGRPRWQSD
jgi:CRISPR-associated protein Cmr2